MAQLMKTSNPALNSQVFRREYSGVGDTMTLEGTVNKTGILLLCTMATAAWAWHAFMQTRSAATVLPYLWIGLIGGFVVALVVTFKKTWAPVGAPVYALLEGLALGSISSVLELRFPGIAIESVALTFGTLLVLLLVYRTGIIRVTDKFRLGVIAATGGIALFYLAEIALGFFGIHFNSINGSGIVGIGFSVFVVIIAALNLVLDFDFVESGVTAGAPKYMEWYGAFGLMVTLVWLYLEIFRLLTKTRSN
ncbi:Bax inhibitor-1/YccA family protein [Edaphobacter sp.]|uniref:Bax inhibitor-1/YccA family protein n=1 Tax=Edaphobacter sp. TaxID=1934404 RepID=UPI002DBDE613|nr:Bax inhibitor-1/YccA family protein [Edaphobacter sp.]HEU5340635.1 Bax inhibitor-1/YccA family protein [Edaphobacter sp.]